MPVTELPEILYLHPLSVLSFFHPAGEWHPPRPLGHRISGTSHLVWNRYRLSGRTIPYIHTRMYILHYLLFVFVDLPLPQVGGKKNPELLLMNQIALFEVTSTPCVINTSAPGDKLDTCSGLPQGCLFPRSPELSFLLVGYPYVCHVQSDRRGLPWGTALSLHPFPTFSCRKQHILNMKQKLILLFFILCFWPCCSWQSNFQAWG